MYNNSQSICCHLLFVPRTASDKNSFNAVTEAVIVFNSPTQWLGRMCKILQQTTVTDVTDPKIGRTEDYKMYSIYIYIYIN
jgi:hypothetical protein